MRTKQAGTLPVVPKFGFTRNTGLGRQAGRQHASLSSRYEPLQGIQQMMQKFHKIGKLAEAAEEFAKINKSEGLAVHFRGTVKAHGAHADLVMDESLSFQSSNRVITDDKELFGFVAWMKARPYLDLFEFPELRGRRVMISGEFCGPKIQKDVGVAELPLFFYIFAIRIDRSWVDMESYSHVSLPAHRIYNARSFKHFDTVVRLDQAEQELPRLQDLASQVQICCPLARPGNNR